MDGRTVDIAHPHEMPREHSACICRVHLPAIGTIFSGRKRQTELEASAILALNNPTRTVRRAKEAHEATFDARAVLLPSSELRRDGGAINGPHGCGIHWNQFLATVVEK